MLQQLLHSLLGWFEAEPLQIRICRFFQVLVSHRCIENQKHEAALHTVTRLLKQARMQ